MIQARVTAVYSNNPKQVAFGAVKVDEQGNRIDARTIIYVHSDQEHMSIDPALGQIWQVEGTVENSEQHHDGYIMKAETFKYPTLTPLLPNSNEAFVRFISEDRTFKGIGESKARELWRQFGSQIFEICENKDFHPLLTVLSKKSIEGLFKGFEKYSNLKYTEQMKNWEIPLPIQKRLIKVHKSDSIEQIKENPYHLVTMGLSFRQADAIAFKHFDYTKEHEYRLAASIESALKNHSGKGHTVARATDLKPHLEGLLSAYNGLVDKALEVGANKLSYLRINDRYHLTSAYIMEKVIAKRFKALSTQKDAWTNNHQSALSKMLNELPYPLTDEQLDAIKASMTNSISCITGGAGTGKTTVIRTALRAYNEMGFTIIPVALSGRASKRMHESIGFITSTIARLLREEPVPEGKQLLVIDESGMVDVPTMYQLIKHMHPSVRIMLVGDPHQLPPIGSGIVLQDTINSNAIAVSELTIVQRQSADSGVPDYANSIKNGEMPPSLTTGCITFHDNQNNLISQESVNKLVRASSQDAIVIAPTKKIVREINELAQSHLNPNGKPLELSLYEQKYRTDFRLNDPVIFTKNNYSAGIQNGSLGKIVSVDGWGSVKLEDSSILELDQDLFDTLELAYGITLHKAQGSQFSTVIVALTDSRMVDRSWLYTAVTRVEDRLEIVGSELTFKKAVSRISATHSRMTALEELIAS